jgi:photosystem II stability/assembly factor-like uncharacterized protein
MFKAGVRGLFITIGYIFLSVGAYANNTPQIHTHINPERITSIACDTTAQSCLGVGFEFKFKKLSEKASSFSMENTVYKTKDGGKTWGEPQHLSHGIHDAVLDGWDGMERFMFASKEAGMKVYCNASAQKCLVAGPKVINKQFYTIVHQIGDAGLTSSHEAALLPTPDLADMRVDGIACSDSGNQCLLLNYPYVYTSDDLGTTWSSPRLLPEPASGYETHDGAYRDTQMRCSDSGLMCTVIAHNQYPADQAPIFIYVTKDGGATWSTPYALEAADKQIEATDTDVISGLHCDSSGLKCMALRARLLNDEHVLNTRVDVYTTEDSGVHWDNISQVDNQDGMIEEALGPLDCDKTGNTCVVIHAEAGTEDATANAYITHDRGQSWTHQRIAEANSFWGLTDIACDDSGVLCQVVGIKDIYEVPDALRAEQPNIQAQLQQAHLKSQRKAQN